MTTSLPAAFATPTMRSMHRGQTADAGASSAAGTSGPEGPGAWLAALAHRRDAAAWSLLIAASAPDLHRLASRILGDAAAADDAIQEVFLAVRDGAGRFRPWTGDADADAVRWLRRITVHVCCHQLRGERRRAQRHRLAVGGSPAEHRGASDRLIAQEQAALVRRALAALPTHTRDAIVAHHLDGGTYQDVAREHGCPVGTVKARVSRGLEAMRMSLAKSGVALSADGLGAGIAALASPGTGFSVHAINHLLRPLLRSKRIASMPIKGALTLKGTLAALAGVAVACAVIAVVASVATAAHRAAPAPPAPRTYAVASPPVAVAVPVLQPLPEGVAVAFVIPDIGVALDRLQTAAAGADPAAAAFIPQLRSSITALLGEDALAPGAHGACMDVMPITGGGKDGVLLVMSRTPATMCAAVRAAGHASRADGSLVQVADTTGEFLPADRALADYTQLSAMVSDGDCALLCSPRRIARAQGAAARSAVQGALPLIALAISQKLGGDAMEVARATLLSVDVALAAAAEIETLCLDVRVNARSLILTASLSAVAGSGLAGVLQPIAPDADQEAAMRARVGAEPGMCAIAGRYPFFRWLMYLTRLAGMVPDAAERDVVPVALRDAALRYFARFDGPMACAWRVGVDGRSHIDAAYACADGAGTHQDAQALWSALNEHGLMQRMLAAQHVQLIYTPAGDHVRGADGAEYPVDIVRTEVLPGLPAPQAAAMRAASQPPSYTGYLPQCVLQAQDPADLRAMALPNSAPLARAPAPGDWSDADGVAWCDLPMLASWQMQQIAIAAAAGRGVVTAPTAVTPSQTPPTVAAWRVGAGQLQARVALPVEGLATVIALLKPYVDAQLEVATPQPAPVPKHEF